MFVVLLWLFVAGLMVGGLMAIRDALREWHASDGPLRHVAIQSVVLVAMLWGAAYLAVRTQRWWLAGIALALIAAPAMADLTVNGRVREEAETFLLTRPEIRIHLGRMLRPELDWPPFEAYLTTVPLEQHRALRNGWLCVWVFALERALSQAFLEAPELINACIATTIAETVAECDWHDAAMVAALQPTMNRRLPKAWEAKPHILPALDWYLAIIEARTRDGKAVVVVADSTAAMPSDIKFQVQFGAEVPAFITRIRDQAKSFIIAGIRDFRRIHTAAAP